MKRMEDIVFPDDWGYDWQELDRQASTLSLDDAEIFCCGEVGEANELVVKTGFHDLHGVLNQIFDGGLSEYFWNIN